MQSIIGKELRSYFGSLSRGLQVFPTVAASFKSLPNHQLYATEGDLRMESVTEADGSNLRLKCLLLYRLCCARPSARL